MDSPIPSSLNRFPQTNQLQYIKKSIFPAVWKHADAWPFYTPVDPNKHNCPDYFSIIQKPMDLGTIKSKLNGGMYSCSQQCISDFELMFDNCFNYNRGKNEVYASLFISPRIYILLVFFFSIFTSSKFINCLGHHAVWYELAKGLLGVARAHADARGGRSFR